MIWYTSYTITFAPFLSNCWSCKLHMIYHMQRLLIWIYKSLSFHSLCTIQHITNNIIEVHWYNPILSFFYSSKQVCTSNLQLRIPRKWTQNSTTGCRDAGKRACNAAIPLFHIQQCHPFWIPECCQTVLWIHTERRLW